MVYTRANPYFSAFFHNLGVGPALSIIGGIAIAMLPIPFALYVVPLISALGDY